MEWRIHFCFPLLVLCWRCLGPWLTTAATLALSYALVLAFLDVPNLSRFNSQHNGLSPQYLGLFALGMLACGITSSEQPTLSRLRTRLLWGWLTAAAFVVLVAATLVLPQSLATRPLLDPVAGLFVACLLVAASRPGGFQTALSLKPLVFIGSFAYSLHLIHFPVVQMVWQYLVHPLRLGPTISLLLHWLLGIPLCVACAYGFHLAFERPFMSNTSKSSP